MSSSSRKGARNKATIPQEILEALNKGSLETANLVEWLAVDQWMLLHNVLAETNYEYPADVLVAKWKPLAGSSVNSIMKTIGLLLADAGSQHEGATYKLLHGLLAHPSDIVRSWVGYGFASLPGHDFADTLSLLRPLAADSHFGVRETAWMAMRPVLAENLSVGMNLLEAWVYDEDENIRRFATEVSRPRGVWCAHLPALKAAPELALGLLQPLHADPSRYVQNSVANWLNDAGKTKPAFVKELCSQWQQKSAAAATLYITKRALRNL